MNQRVVFFSMAVLLALSTVVWVQPARAGATFTVASTVDSVDAQPGNGVCATAWSVCTLRAAVMEANALPGDDIITLPAGTYLLTLEGALNITDKLTLTGAGAAATIVQANKNSDPVIDSVLGIYSTTASITNITVRGKSTLGGGGGISNNGQLMLNNSVVSNNHAGGGGGIFNSGIATVTNSTVSDNTASGNGGGIFNVGTLALINSTVSSNTANTNADGSANKNYTAGGGIYNTGTLTLTNTTISRNTANGSNKLGSGNPGHGHGGGIYNTSTLTLTNSTISNNDANVSAGIYNEGTLTLTTSTISGNHAENRGGGIGNEGTLMLMSSTISGNHNDFDGGGGIFNNGTATVTNSTISGNSAGHYEGYGGGIYNTGTLAINNGTIANNHGDGRSSGDLSGGAIFNSDNARSTVIIKNTILANNTNIVSPADDCSGTLTSQGYNLIANTTGCTITGDTTGNITGKGPLLGELKNNGGPTWTHALLRVEQGYFSVVSPAIDAGDPHGCKDAHGQVLSTDQRAVNRPQGPRCDIGAYEVGVIVPVGLPTVGPVPTIGPNSTIAPGLTPAPTLHPIPTLGPVPTIGALPTIGPNPTIGPVIPPVASSAP